MGVNDGITLSSGANDTQVWSRLGTNGYSAQQTISCPPGFYATGIMGKSGADVNQLSGLHCRNIITNATQDVNGGPLGGSGGGNGGGLNAPGTDGLAGFAARAQTEVESLKTIYRGAQPKSCCGGTTYKDSSRMGTNQQNGDYVCDQNHLVQSISGGTSQHNQYLTNFSWTCRNFNNMANIGKSPLDCCIGADTSQDCRDVQQYLNCPAVVADYCSTGTNIFTDPKCLAALAAPNPVNGLSPAVAANLKLKTCGAGSNHTMDFCSDFCTAKTGLDIPVVNTNTDALISGNTIKDGCNNLYQTKCSKDSTPAVCGCQRDFATYPGASDIPSKAEFVKDPACYFSACRNFGYFSKPLSEHGCPSCIQYQQLNVTGSDIALSQIQQTCTVNGVPPSTSAPASLAPTTTTSPTTTSAPTGTSTLAPTSAPSATSSKTKTLTVVLAAVILLCALASIISALA